MNPNDPNVMLLELVADRLGGELRSELVFVGGAVAGILITDPALPAIRATQDVDVIVHAAVLSDYHRIESALRARGFVNDTSPQAPICRWRVDSALVDVMPASEKILGFANRWYPLALESAVLTTLPSGLQIKVIGAAVFLATKLEAFRDRGNGDYLFSHDLGDLIAVVDGRDTLVDECGRADPMLRAYLKEWTNRLLGSSRFLEALPGHVPTDAGSQARVPDLVGKLRALGSLNA
jgi:predicted nucleotidyltransferase